VRLRRGERSLRGRRAVDGLATAKPRRTFGIEASGDDGTREQLGSMRSTRDFEELRCPGNHARVDAIGHLSTCHRVLL